MKNLLLLAPHADDEIFSIPHAKYFESKDYCITLLLLSGTVRRYAEARESCQMLGWSCLSAKGLGSQFTDGLFHHNLHNLAAFLENIIYQYSLVLCPALEGGHQDHDSTFLACIIARFYQPQCKILFYKTYTATGRWKLFEVFSNENNYSTLNFAEHIALKQRFWVTRVVISLLVYRSQWTSWIVLLPAMILAAINGRKEVVYSLEPREYDKALTSILDTNSSALYELHQRCTKKEWLCHVRPIFFETIVQLFQKDQF
jgi:hypothetical protein